MTRRWLWLTTVADLDGPGRELTAVLARWPAPDSMAVCALRTVSPDFRRAIPATIETIELGIRRSPDLRVWPRLIRACRAWAPDVLHTQLSRADWTGRVVGRVLGIPVVSTIHNVHSRMYRAEFAAPLAGLGLVLDRLTLPLADRVVAVSNGVRADIVGAHARPDVRVIRNGLDLQRVDRLRTRDEVRRAWRVPADARIAGTVARLKHQKGISHLIEAARLVCAAMPDAWFVHMGDGPLAVETARRVSDAGLAQRFLLCGHVDDAMTWLPGLDLFVLPSLWEGLPIALLEAMATGLPAVGTQVSGVDELIDERSGVLVPPEDPTALAAAIVALLNDDERRLALGQAGRARAYAMDAAVPAAAYRELFLEVTAARDSQAKRGA